MQSICITGATHTDLQLVLEILQAAGVAPVRHARRGADLVSMDTWHERILAMAAEDTTAGVPIAIDRVGKLWEQLAGDIFVANIQSPVWAWADSRSTWALDFWSGFEPRLKFVLVCASPQHTLATALVHDDVHQRPVSAILESWHQHHQELLRFYHRYPDRCILVDLEECVAHPKVFLERCQQQWRLDIDTAQVFDAQPIRPAPIAQYLAHQLCLQQHAALSLQAEITASRKPLVSGVSGGTADDSGTAVLDPEMLLGHYQALQRAADRADVLDDELDVVKASLATQCNANQALTLQLDAETKAKNDALAQRDAEAQAKKEALAKCDAEAKAKNDALAQLQALQNTAKYAQEENELLLTQLHQVQEELEQQFIGAREATESYKKERSALESRLAKQTQEAQQLAAEIEKLRRSIGDCTAQRDAEAQAKKEALAKCDAEAKAKNDALAQLQALQNTAKDAQEENELLLTQLHQVQEELEHYFLQHRDAQAQLDAQQRRWQDMSRRKPDFFDYESLTLLSTKADNDAPTASSWRLVNFTAAGRTFDQLEFEILVQGEMAGIAFTSAPNSSCPLVRRPADSAQQDRVVFTVAGASTQEKLQALQTLQHLATSDWDLLQILPRVMVQALQQPAGHIQTTTPIDAEPLIAALHNLSAAFERVNAPMRFDEIALKQSLVNPHDEHLCLRLSNICCNGHRWTDFEYRLSCAIPQGSTFGQHFMLAFPAGAGQAPFEAWFEESTDSLGPKLELRFAQPDAMDLKVWERLSWADQQFVLALAKSLTDQLTVLRGSGAKPGRSWDDWLALAANVQRILALRARSAQSVVVKN